MARKKDVPPAPREHQGPIMGWRAWRLASGLDGSAHLRGMRGVEWRGPVLQAEHIQHTIVFQSSWWHRPQPRPWGLEEKYQHDAPARGCFCGIYQQLITDPVNRFLDSDVPVMAAGATEITETARWFRHEWGYRASEVRIIGPLILSLKCLGASFSSDCHEIPVVVATQVASGTAAFCAKHSGMRVAREGQHHDVGDWLVRAAVDLQRRYGVEVYDSHSLEVI